MIMSETIRGWFINLRANPSLDEILKAKASSVSPGVAVFDNGVWSEVTGSDTYLNMIDEFLNTAGNDIAAARPPISMFPSNVAPNTVLNAGEYLKCVLYAAKECSLVYDPVGGDILRNASIRLTCPVALGDAEGVSYALSGNSPLSMAVGSAPVAYTFDPYTFATTYNITKGFRLLPSDLEYYSASVFSDQIRYRYPTCNDDKSGYYDIHFEADPDDCMDEGVIDWQKLNFSDIGYEINAVTTLTVSGWVSPEGYAPSARGAYRSYLMKIAFQRGDGGVVATDSQGHRYMRVYAYLFPNSDGQSSSANIYAMPELVRRGRAPELGSDELPFRIWYDSHGAIEPMWDIYRVRATPLDTPIVYPCIATTEYSTGNIVVDYTGKLDTPLITVTGASVSGSINGGNMIMSVPCSFKKIDSWAQTSARVPSVGNSESPAIVTPTGLQDATIALRVTVPQGTSATSLTNLVDVSTSVPMALVTAISNYNERDGSPIFDNVTRQNIIDYISTSATMGCDAYMATEADYTGLVISQYFVDAALVAATEKSSAFMQNLFGLDINTNILYDSEVEGNYSILAYVNGEHPKQDMVTQVLVEARSYLTFRLLLHNVLKKAATTSEYLNTVGDIIDHLATETYQMFTSVATMGGKGSVVNEALMYSYADQNNAIDKVRAFMDMASSFGATSFESAYNLLVMNMPNASQFAPPTIIFDSDNEINIGDVLTEILEQSSYAGGISNTMISLRKTGSETPYWSTWGSRMASAVFSVGGVDSEIGDCGGGADYIFPAITHGYVNGVSTDIWDHYLPYDNATIMCPFEHSYLEIRRGEVQGTVEVSWYARFRGGTERDALDAIQTSYLEWQKVISDMSSIVFNEEPVHITFPDIPNALNPGYSDDLFDASSLQNVLLSSQALSLFGDPQLSISKLASAAFSSALDSASKWARGMTVDYMETFLSTVLDDPDARARVNASISLSKLWDIDINQLSITVNNTAYGGNDALNLMNTLLVSIVSNGGFAPFSYGVDASSSRVAVLSADRIPARYVAREVDEDWSPIVLGACVFGAAIYGIWWKSLPHVRAASFLPAVVLGVASSAASSVAHKVSSALAARTAKESTLLSLANSMNEVTADTSSAIADIQQQQKEDSAKLTSILAAVGAGGLILTTIGVLSDRTAKGGSLETDINDHVSKVGQDLKKTFKGNRPTLPA